MAECPPAKLATATGVEVSEFIENFDKPEGLSAVIDEKHESDEYVCGKWRPRRKGSPASSGTAT